MKLKIWSHHFSAQNLQWLPISCRIKAIAHKTIYKNPLDCFLSDFISFLFPQACSAPLTQSPLMFLKHPGMFLPQAFFPGCSLCLESSFPREPQDFFPQIFRKCKNVTFSERPPLPLYLKLHIYIFASFNSHALSFSRTIWQMWLIIIFSYFIIFFFSPLWIYNLGGTRIFAFVVHWCVPTSVKNPSTWWLINICWKNRF